MTQNSGAALIATTLKARGTERVFALCGGHIMPIWMALDDAGIEIVDVRDERSAVYMAHAHAALTGRFSVALVTAGPGVTNAITGVANAHVSRSPVLVLAGSPPRPQEGRGALQDLDHCALMRPITRIAKKISTASSLPRELDFAISAALGIGGEPGPCFLDIPVDVQRDILPRVIFELEQVEGRAKPRARAFEEDLDVAAELIQNSNRPVVISGRGANDAADALPHFLEVSGAAYLDTGETKGILPESHPAQVGAMRGAALSGADLIITIGRKLDFQLAYGSPAIFGSTKFLRISDVAQELNDNRLGDMALLGNVEDTLEKLSKRLADKRIPREWVEDLRRNHQKRSTALIQAMETAPSDAFGRLHPNRLLGEIRKRLKQNAIVIADGGDILSFARVGLSSSTYLDPGPLGCIGMATPFAIGAAKAAPERQVVAVTGDGAFGFTAIEMDTAKRHNVPMMIVVSNNGSWAIEVRDQMDRFGKAVGTHLQFADYAGMARSFGLKAWRIEGEDALAPDLDAAFAAYAEGHTVLVDVITSPEAVSSDSKTGLAIVPDFQALSAWDDAERNWLEEKH